jgi:transposase
MRSEKEAYDHAMNKLSTIDVTLDSVRLDRYHSSPGYVDSFGFAWSRQIVPKVFYREPNETGGELQGGVAALK